MASAADPWRGRPVLVTGAGGFVGANLVRRLLARGARVHALVRPGGDRWRLAGAGEATIREADVTRRDDVAAALEAAAPEVVFHLARPTGGPEAWEALALTPARTASHLVEALRRAPATRLVVAGSSLEYGPSGAPHREDDPLAPVTWHGVGKAAAGLLYLQAARAHGLRVHQLRLFHVYGPWEHGHRLLPSAIRAALSGAPLPVTAPGFRRDYVHVDDVVEAFLAAAATAAPAGVFNVGSGVEASNEELLALVEQATGRPIAREGAFPASASDAAHRRADLGRARAVLGWSPALDLAAGVAATVEWHRRHPSFWERGLGGRPAHA